MKKRLHDVKSEGLYYVQPTCALDVGRTDKPAGSQGNAGRAEREKTNQNDDFKHRLGHWQHPQGFRAELTATISALEMEGAMLRMNREQVLWSGRGLGESSLGFFSSLFSSAAAFGFSSAS